MGDFSVVSSANEKLGSAPVNPMNMKECNLSMFHCGLSAVDFVGSRFTWTNGSIWQRLDRVLVNDQWLSFYTGTR